MKQSQEVAEYTRQLDALRHHIAASEKIDSRSQIGKQILNELCWASFSPSVREWVVGQIRRCRDDFRYLAGNYIWLYQPRGGKPTTLDLNDSQELIFEMIEYQWRNGRPGWILLHKARQVGGCLLPSTRILTSDYRWVEIDEVKVGDVLIGVDEDYPPSGSKRAFARRMRKSVVENRRDVFDIAMRLTMDNGEILVATPDHRFLWTRRPGGNATWRHVRDMRVGDHIRSITKTWENPKTVEEAQEDGWFGGILDGEGSLRAKQGAGAEVTVTQTYGPVYDRAARYLNSRGYALRHQPDNRKGGGKNSKLGTKPIGKVTIGRMNQIFKLVGSTRPTRFVERTWWEGKELPGKGGKMGPGNGDGAWSKIISIELLTRQRMVDLQTSTKTFIAEGFVSHNSSLSIGFGVWQSAFFTNRCCMMIAQDAYHAPYAFRNFQYCLFNLPYWMSPNVHSLEEKQSMILGVHDVAGVGGLNNYIMAFQAGKMSAFAQGKAITFLWATEVANWPEEKARRILKGDLREALVSKPGAIAIIETKPEGAAGFWYDFWHENEKEGRRSYWYSAFIPCFFEKRRTTKVPKGFRPTKEERMIRERYMIEWKRCVNPKCGATYYAGGAGGTETATCHACGGAHGEGIVLSDEQLGWYRVRRAEVKTEEDMILFKQELAITAEEGFQVHGKKVFPADVIAYLQSTVIDPRWYGEFRTDFSWHDKFGPVCNEHAEHRGQPRCSSCHEDHSEEEMYLSIWEFPRPNESYHMGVDAAYGLESGDFGCITIHRQGKGMQDPDVQVAEYRGRVDAGELGTIAYILGHIYNYCEAAIEVMNGPGEKTQLSMIQKGYDNLWRWKHYDAIHMLSNRLGWVTNARTKPMLITNFIQWCRQRIVRIQSKEFLFEINSFVRQADYDESGGAARGRKDDTIMSNLICNFTFHDEHWDQERGRIVIPQRYVGEPTVSADHTEHPYWVTCTNGHQMGVDNPHRFVCPECLKLNPDRKVFALSAMKTISAPATRSINVDQPAEPSGWDAVMGSDMVELLN